MVIPPRKPGVCILSRTRKGSFFLRHSTISKYLFTVTRPILTNFRFHPAIQRVRVIIDSGELGAIKEVNATLALPKGILGNDNDIRMNYDLGGGAMMDCGCQFPSSRDESL